MNKTLNDIWTNIQSYYTDIINLLPKIILAAVVFSLFMMVANKIRSFVKNRLTAQMDDPLLAIFLSRVVKTVIVIIGCLVVLQILGLAGIAAGIVTGASVSAIVIGFAFKDIGENFLAGIMLAFNRPFRVGDTVELDGHKGQVVALNLRNSRIKSFDGKDIFIPNANVVKNPVVNYTLDGFLRYDFAVGLDYGSNISEAMTIIMKELKSTEGIIQEGKKPVVVISDLASSSLELTVYYWLDTFDKTISSGNIKTQVVDNVLTALNNAGFYMPGDILEVKNYNKDALRTGQDAT